MSGPWSFAADDEPGALVHGQDAPGTTGRPWRPRYEAELLEAMGFEVVEEARTWRLPAREVGPEDPPAAEDVDLPRQAGSYVDRRLVLDRIAAVPDLTEALGGAGLRGAWGLAKRARAADWEGCTVVRCTGRPEVEVPRLVRVAARAGYSWVVAPWSPDADAAPETVHRRYRLRW
jgi:hypothetical protein